MSSSPLVDQAGLVGRSVEVAKVQSLLVPGRVVTLTGVGGAGKTRIARRVIADSTSTYPAGVWVAELADFVDPALLGEVVAGALDVKVPPGPWDGTVLANFFATRPGLLVLDNCEHIIEAVAELTNTLLIACPDLTVLATSRQPLDIRRETIFQVPPLSAPEQGTHLSLANAPGFDSIALYVQRASEAMATFQLTTENVDTVGELVRRLEGVPLAIELAAARVRTLSPHALLSRLAERFDVLESDLRDVPARQRSMTASLGWSYDLCTPDEQELWNRLTVFAGGFELDAVVGVCSGAGIEPADIVRLLSALVDLSVVDRVGETGSRYRMLESIRQFGADQLLESGHQHQVRDRHLAWYADLVESINAGWFSPNQLTGLDQLRAEHPNVRVALEHALSNDETADVALRMCADLEPLWVCGGHLGEARRWIERAVAGTRGQPDVKIRALRLCAWFGALQHDLPYASECVAQTQALLAQTDEPVSEGHYLFAAGVVATYELNFAEGVELLLRSAAVFEQAGHLPGQLEARLNTAIAHIFASDYTSAADVCATCLETTDRLQEIYVGSYARWALGLGALMAGDVPEAVRLTTEALTRSASLGDQLAMALELESLAWLSVIQFDFERGIRILGGADSLWRMLNMPVAQTPGIAEFRALGESQVREAIGATAFEEFFAAGSTMEPAAIVDFALEVDPDVPVAESPPSGPLSRRETEVAALVAEGLSNRDIAERLFISERTAQGHVQSILRKLMFNSRAQIAVWFVGHSRPVPGPS